MVGWSPFSYAYTHLFWRTYELMTLLEWVLLLFHGFFEDWVNILKSWTRVCFRTNEVMGSLKVKITKFEQKFEFKIQKFILKSFLRGYIELWKLLWVRWNPREVYHVYEDLVVFFFNYALYQLLLCLTLRLHILNPL